MVTTPDATVHTPDVPPVMVTESWEVAVAVTTVVLVPAVMPVGTVMVMVCAFLPTVKARVTDAAAA